MVIGYGLMEATYTEVNLLEITMIFGTVHSVIAQE